MSRWILLSAMVVAMTGCAVSRQVSDPFESTGAPPRSIRINVVNNNFNEATIRAIGRTERRLGIVPGNGREAFTLAWPAVDNLRIRIDILAGDSYTTNGVTVGPGDTVHLTVVNPLYRSQLRR